MNATTTTALLTEAEVTALLARVEVAALFTDSTPALVLDTLGNTTAPSYAPVQPLVATACSNVR